MYSVLRILRMDARWLSIHGCHWVYALWTYERDWTLPHDLCSVGLAEYGQASTLPLACPPTSRHALSIHTDDSVVAL